MATHWTRMILITFCAVTLGCTSTLKVVSGRYAYYEVVDGEAIYFPWNPMSQRYSLAVLEGAQPCNL